MSDSSDPIETYRAFIDALNREDLDALDGFWSQPFVYATADEAKVHPRYREFVDFDGLRAAGWARTRIDSVELLTHDGATVVLTSQVSRLRTDDSLLAVGKLTFVMSQVDGRWRIQFGLNHSNLPSGR